MKTILILLATCLGICSCRVDVTPPETFSATAEIISADVSHDSFIDGTHDMYSVVKYRIITPADMAGREFSRFTPLRDGTNTTPSVGAIVKIEVEIAVIAAQPLVE